MRRNLAVVAFIALTLTASLAAQAKPDAPEFDIKEHYTKYEYRIPMRDGVHLFTSIYVPKDTSRAYPFLINRTPYSVGPYGGDLYRRQLGYFLPGILHLGQHHRLASGSEGGISAGSHDQSFYG